MLEVNKKVGNDMLCFAYQIIHAFLLILYLLNLYVLYDNNQENLSQVL